jgi:hypothetical protein
MALRPIGAAAQFFLTRHWQRTVIGPYVLTTVEIRPGTYETSVTWGDGGPEIDAFGSGRAFDREAAEDTHREMREAIEHAAGPNVASRDFGLPPAA